MFELMVVNQWHVISQGYITATTKWARLYFAFFHVTSVIVSLKYFVLVSFKLKLHFSFFFS